MYITVGRTQPTAHEVDDLTSLSIHAFGGAHSAAMVGDLDEDCTHVWMPLTLLRTISEAALASDHATWLVSFDDMIAYATRKGWVSADGRAVRIHIVDRG